LALYKSFTYLLTYCPPVQQMFTIKQCMFHFGHSKQQ